MKRDLKMMDFKDGKREKKIIKTAFIGIVTNFFLAGAKIFIAMVSNSVALISDVSEQDVPLDYLVTPTEVLSFISKSIK